MIFIDGVGIGKADSEYNPFFKFGFRTFENIFNQIPHLGNSYLHSDSIYLKAVDANLGVDGLPQSGTGQVQFSVVLMLLKWSAIISDPFHIQKQLMSCGIKIFSKNF